MGKSSRGGQGLGYLVYEDKLRELGLCSVEKGRLNIGLPDVMEKLKVGFSQLCMAEGQVSMGMN